MVIYIDISQHDAMRRDAPVNLRQVADAGYGGVMCARVSYGDPQVFAPASPAGQRQLADARAAGFVARGGYHNLIRGDQASINRQVDQFRAALDAGRANWAMLDVEPYEELRTRGLTPRWEDVLAFQARWLQLEYRTLAYYVGAWVWRDWLGRANLNLLRGPLINANYKGGTGTPTQIYAAAGGDNGPGWGAYGGRVPDIWQFTSSATVPGASGRTDCNAYRGSREDLIRLLTGLNAPQPSTREQEADVPIFYRIIETGHVGVSDGPTRYGYSTMEDLQEALAAWGKTLRDLRSISQAQVTAYGADIAELAEGEQLTLTDEQLARLIAAVPTADTIRSIVDDELDEQSRGGADAD